MDIDLSTDLGAFPKLVSAVSEGGYDVAAGSRLSSGSETTRSLKREVLSRGFVFTINTFMRTKLQDTQCGFKAIRRECALSTAALRSGRRLVLGHGTPAPGRKGWLGGHLRPGPLAGGCGQSREDRVDGLEGPQGPDPHAALRLGSGSQSNTVVRSDEGKGLNQYALSNLRGG